MAWSRAALIWATVVIGAIWGTGAWDGSKASAVPSSGDRISAARGVAIGPPSDAGPELNGKKDRLQGVWRLHSTEAPGGRIEGDEAERMHLIITKGLIVNHGPEGEIVYTYTVDKKKPGQIDLVTIMGDTGWHGKTIPAIFAVDGDQLSLCMCVMDRGERPLGFKASRSTRLCVYKRIISFEPPKSK